MRKHCCASGAKRRAFTIIEIVIVLSVLGIMAIAVSLPVSRGQTATQNVNAVRVLRDLAVAMEAYRNDETANNPGYLIGNSAGLFDVDPNFTQVNPYNVYSHLTTPTAYLSGPLPADAYVPQFYTDDIDSTTGLYTVKTPTNAATAAFRAPRYYTPGMGGFKPGFDARYYVLISAGPDLVAPDIKGLGPTYTSEAAVLNNLYDPTNGAASKGDIYRVGGDALPSLTDEAPARMLMNVVQKRGGYVTPAIGSPGPGGVAMLLLDGQQNETIYNQYYEMNADNKMDSGDAGASLP